MTEMIAFITRYYDMDEASAREVIAEMRDTKSLQSLAVDCRVARAVAPPALDLHGA
jgi:hypothetical protein